MMTDYSALQTAQYTRSSKLFIGRNQKSGVSSNACTDSIIKRGMSCICAYRMLEPQL